MGDTGNSRVAVIGPHSAIWDAFVERVNAARIAEYQELMAEYVDYYRGSSERSRKRTPYTGEGAPAAGNGL